MAWDQSAFEGYLNQKYAIQAQEAGARQTEAQAQARLSGAQAGNITAKTPAEVAQLQAQTKAIPVSTAGEYARNVALARNYTAESQLIPFQAQNLSAEAAAAASRLTPGFTVDPKTGVATNTSAEGQAIDTKLREGIYHPNGFVVPNVDLGYGAGMITPEAHVGAHATAHVYRGVDESNDPYALTGTSSLPETDSTTLSAIGKLGGGLGVANPSGGGVSPLKPTGFSKGTAKVPGKGDGTKDSVSAKLAPGEAVLNKPAAEHMGRGLIGVLNAIGEHKLGMAKAA